MLPPPEIETDEDLETFNNQLLERCMADLCREHYAKKEKICDLFAEEQKALVALPNEKFRIFTLEKVKTDKYSFVRFDGNGYTTSPEYPKCEMRNAA